MKNVKLMMLLALSTMAATAVYAMDDMDDEAISMQDDNVMDDQAQVDQDQAQEDVNYWQRFKNGLKKTDEYIAYPFQKTYQAVTYPVRKAYDWYYGPTEEPVVEPEDEGIEMPEDEQAGIMRQVKNDSEQLLKVALQQDEDMTRYTHGIVSSLREGNVDLAIDLLKAGLNFIERRVKAGQGKEVYNICEAEFRDMLERLSE